MGGKVVRETFGTTATVDYLYDNNGRPYQITVKEGTSTNTGYFVLNQQGDVIALTNANGAVAVVTVAAIAYSKTETSGKLKSKYTYKEKSIRKMSKGGKQRIKDLGLADLSDEEISDLYKNPETSKEYRQRLKKEQKARELRNRQKRNNNRHKGKKKR